MTMRIIVALCFLLFCAGMTAAQKGTADFPEFYPQGYAGDTWAGEVTAFDNDKRTLTLTYTNGKDVQTFVASIPDAPYEWTRDSHKSRVLDFPYDKEATSQLFVYTGKDFATLLPGDTPATVHRPNPPADNVINDFVQFQGRRIVVYYTPRAANGVKYNDVWRVRVLPKK
jgi:hypothetical protein